MKITILGDTENPKLKESGRRGIGNGALRVPRQSRRRARAAAHHYAMVAICRTLVIMCVAERADILRIGFPGRGKKHGKRGIYLLHASQPWLQVDAHEAQEHVEQPQDAHLEPQVQAPDAQLQLESQEQAMVVFTRKGSRGLLAGLCGSYAKNSQG